MIRVIFALFSIGTILFSQPVQVWIPDCQADSGQAFTIPIRIDSVTGRGIIGVDITLSFRQAVLRAESVWAGNVVPGGWMIFFNTNNPGELIIAMAGAYPLSGQGSLCTLKFSVRGRIGDTTTIHFSRCLLNEGNVPCSTRDGRFTVTGVGIKGNNLEKIPVLRVSPNPFRKYTQICYELSKGTLVRVSLYDISGEKVISLFEGFSKAGLHVKRWNGERENGIECEKGIYFLVIENEEYKLKQKILKL